MAQEKSPRNRVKAKKGSGPRGLKPRPESSKPKPSLSTVPKR